MILELEEAKKLCDWLTDKGLGLGECADLLMYLGGGDTFAIALFKVFSKRKEKTEKLNEEIPYHDWTYSTNQLFLRK